MGEVVVSSEEALELEVLQEVESEKKRDGAGASGGVVRWERFLPRMVLRVLLVEADDSTRQIIAALLRKCSYRVAAVPDGLKAWEVLKGRPNSIDLILTEVELPSISGFALLTLIMEHDICKNIPVIMMSSHDSISTVYKCMLRGAADFLVKPIRRNELRNLWQHVWRRQASSVGKSGPQDESVAQQKVEATAENNATSNHSSGSKACVQISKDGIEKGSDAQSSCTKPDMEAESAYMENMQDQLQPKWNRSFVGDAILQKRAEAAQTVRESCTLDNVAGGSEAASVKEADAMVWEKDVGLDKEREDLSNTGEACDNNDVLLNSSREAIDLIGTFDNNPKNGYGYSNSNNMKSKLDSSPHLDLSLRRSHPCSTENQIADEKHILHHSNASAFSRYINRALQPLGTIPTSVCYQEKEHATVSDKNLPTYIPNYNSDTSVSNANKSMLTVAKGHYGQADSMVSRPQERVYPVSIPLKGMKFDSFCSGFGSVGPPIFGTQSGPSPIESPSSACYQEGAVPVNKHQSSVETSGSRQLFEPLVKNVNRLINQTRPSDHKLDCLDDQSHFSSATDQTANSKFGNGNASHLNSIGCGSISGSNVTVNPVSIVRSGSEGGNEEGFVSQDGSLNRATQREAALNKFRLKRKDRCFEKKVRYESRKKLAEQRPRVKGQFVRQARTNLPLESDDC